MDQDKCTRYLGSWKCHKEGRQLFEGHNHFNHSTLQFWIYFCILYTWGKTISPSRKSFAVSSFFKQLWSEREETNKHIEQVINQLVLLMCWICCCSLCNDINTIPLPPGYNSSDWMNWNIEQCCVVVNNTASQWPSCSWYTAVCLTTGLPSFPFCSHVFLSATSYQHQLHRLLWTPPNKLKLSVNTRGWVYSLNEQKHTSWGSVFLFTRQHQHPLPHKLKLPHSISSGLLDNIWCIRLWNVCLSSASQLHLPEPLLLWLHADLGQNSYTS